MSRHVTRLALAFLLAGAGVATGAVELYGKPLRGLSAAPLAEVAAGRHQEKAIRVSGTARASGPDGVTISDGDVSLLVHPDGFTLPEDVAGAKVVAEGRARKGDGGVVFAASGLEVRR